MKQSGHLLKMETALSDNVNYTLLLDENRINVNQFIGKALKFTYLDEIKCITCGSITKKSFFQGHCYKCLLHHPHTSPCILHPEKCQAQNGISRDMKWSEEHCLTPHFVYLARSSGVKVGVTRHTQIPTRWIDQGAVEAIILAKTPNRNTAGLIEVYLKKYFADKTSWQRMLKNQVDYSAELLEQKQKAARLLPDELKQFVYDNNEITKIQYPVVQYPEKVKSKSFDKMKIIQGRLTGIKGQYLIFDDNSVLNIRKHSGYLVQLEYD
ncbi:MAG: hypothetical protein CSA05_01335 [Bacteroidia bacterium]|nr:MAG: hypothetical protein CSA05_01335 [Bacteroidia bacterium]